MGRVIVSGAGRMTVPIFPGARIGDLPVGAIVQLNESSDGELWGNYIVVQQGIPGGRTDIYDESCNGTWLLRQDLILTSNPWSTSGIVDYPESNVCSILNMSLEGFSSAVKENLLEVKIPYYNSSTADLSNTIVRFFVLGASELGYVNDNVPIDGIKLEYFVQGNNQEANNKRIANFEESPSAWWTRSVEAENSGFVEVVDIDGSMNLASMENDEGGIRPALILNPNAWINEEHKLVETP